MNWTLKKRKSTFKNEQIKETWANNIQNPMALKFSLSDAIQKSKTCMKLAQSFHKLYKQL